MKRALLSFAILVLSLLWSSIAARAQESGAPESGVFVQQPSPSQTGSEVVFAADFEGPIGLWITNLTGTNLRQLTYNPETDEEPAWSPNGSTIAFASTHQGVTDIWAISPDGSSLRQLTSKSLNNREPTWSPDGSKIAFVSDRGGSNDIWIMNANGSSQTRVTQLTDQENHPAFSPNGQQIVFSETTSSGTASLMIVDIDGSNLRSLTAVTPLVEDWNPQWTTSGIYFSSNRGDTTDHHNIWIVQPNGSGLLQYSAIPAVDPVLLSDGRILFSDEFGTESSSSALSEITLLNPSSGTKQLVTKVASYFVDGDVNLDGAINCLDLVAVKASFGKKVGQAGFNPSADVNHDGVIDIRDLAFVSKHLGSSGNSCQ